jgi:HD-GYP domain-containing protein (c-di-GMP phosphodiesterase class II)
MQWERIPNGLTRIKKEARILGIVDSFAAIIEDRSYRAKRSVKEAVDILVKDIDLYD